MKKWNKSQMARELDISSQLYGKYESGDRKPGADFFIKWKRVFGEDLTSVFETNVSRATFSGTNILNGAEGTEYAPRQVDLIQEVLDIRQRQLAIQATLSVILSELTPLIAKASGRSHASVFSQMKKDIELETLNLKEMANKKK